MTPEQEMELFAAVMVTKDTTDKLYRAVEVGNGTPGLKVQVAKQGERLDALEASFRECRAKGDEKPSRTDSIDQEIVDAGGRVFMGWMGRHGMKIVAAFLGIVATALGGKVLMLYEAMHKAVGK